MNHRILFTSILIAVLSIQPLAANVPRQVESVPLTREEITLLETQESPEIEEIIVGDEIVHHYHNNNSGDAAAAFLVGFLVVFLLLAAAAAA